MTCTVVPFPERDIHDIPRLLRQMADDIEAGEYGSVTSLAAVLENEETILTFGFGAADPMRAIGLFTTGSTMMAQMGFDD